MSKNYLTEAFKELDLLESQSFDVDKKGTSELEDFLEDDSLDDFEVVIDPEAETEEDLQKSYMGKVILMCDVCRSMIYKDPAEIVIDEESQLANVGELCPYCFTGDGYKIVGKVAPYEEVTVEAEKPVEVKVDGEKVEVEDKIEEEIQQDQKFPVEHEKAPVMEDLELKGNKIRNIGTQLFRKYGEELTHSAIEADIDLIKKALNNEDISDWDVEDFVEWDCFDSVEESFTYDLFEKLKNIAEKNEDNKAVDNIEDYLGFAEEVAEFDEFMSKDPSVKAFWGKIKESILSDKEDKTLKESMDDISITTEDQIIKIKSTPREDKETIQPVTETEVEKAKEVEEDLPVEEVKTQEEVVEEPEEIDVDLDEIDEEGMDDLGESYLKSVYENVNGFKTSKAVLQGNKMILEGVISFTSGNKAKTKFTFESKEATKRGKLKFLGENKNISKNKKAFTLIGSLNNKKLMLESLNYNYTGKDSKTGKTKRLYGTIRRKSK